MLSSFKQNTSTMLVLAAVFFLGVYSFGFLIGLILCYWFNEPPHLAHMAYTLFFTIPLSLIFGYHVTYD